MEIEQNKKENRIRIHPDFNPKILEDMEKEGIPFSKKALSVQNLLRSLYYALFFGATSFVFLCFHIYQEGFGIYQSEFICIIMTTLSIAGAGLGIAKLRKKSVVDFKKINLVLIALIVCTLLFIGLKFSPLLAVKMYDFCNKNFCYMLGISIPVLVLTGSILYLNSALTKIYVEYDKKEKGEQLIIN